MPFYKVTYSEKYRRATVHNWGCNFSCRGCSYKLLQPEKPRHYPSLDELQHALSSLDIDSVHFMGGEPTTNPQLPDLLAFCKETLGVTTRLGHTNGSHLPTMHLDGINVSFKAFDEALHLDYTGQPRQPIYDNFRHALQSGLEVKASAVLIPGYVDQDEIGKICEFVANLDPGIPFHLMGFIPIPDTSWRRPTTEEMEATVALAKKYLKVVGFSHLTSEDALNTKTRDDRFSTRRIL